jgi:Sulfatase-modifying factor enzyme 1
MPRRLTIACPPDRVVAVAALLGATGVPAVSSAEGNRALLTLQAGADRRSDYLEMVRATLTSVLAQAWGQGDLTVTMRATCSTRLFSPDDGQRCGLAVIECSRQHSVIRAVPCGAHSPPAVVTPRMQQWEFAARGGLDGAVFTWGDEFAPKGRVMANTWQGAFPWQNLRTDGYEGTSPAGMFPPNGYGLYDMAGNVWEWTCDYFTPRHPEEGGKPCCVPHNPPVAAPEPLAARVGDLRGRPGPRGVP